MTTRTHTTSTAVADSWPDKLIELLERQAALLNRLGELSSAQAALIADGRSESLLELLSRRQAIIDEFSASQREMAKVAPELDRRLPELTETKRQRIRELIGGIGKTLHSVLDRDQRDQQSLHAGCAAVRTDLAELEVGRQARHAYGPGRNSINRFADQQA